MKMRAWLVMQRKHQSKQVCIQHRFAYSPPPLLSLPAELIMHGNAQRVNKPLADVITIAMIDSDLSPLACTQPPSIGTR